MLPTRPMVFKIRRHWQDLSAASSLRTKARGKPNSFPGVKILWGDKPEMRPRKRFLICAFVMLPYLVWMAAAAGDDPAKRKERAHSHLIEARRLAADYKIDKAASNARDALKDDP